MRPFVRFSLALVLVAPVAATLAYYDVLIPSGDVAVSPSSVKAYRVDADRTLLVGNVDVEPSEPGVLLVNRREGFVGRPSWYGRRFGSVILWPRFSYEGVWLKDGVKMDRDHDYRFTGRTLEIDWVLKDRSMQRISVQFAE